MDPSKIPASLVSDAAAWRLAGLLLERPVCGWPEAVSDLAAEVDDPGLRAAAEVAPKAVEGHYLALLGPGGPASPREVAYVGFGDPGRTLAEIRAFHEAFAFGPRTEDPPDHIAVSAGFAGYLRLKEAFALGEGNGEAAATVREARERFESEHLRRVAGPLARKLEEHGPGTAWAAAAAWIHRRVGEEPGREIERIVPEEGGCFPCGEAAGA